MQTGHELFVHGLNDMMDAERQLVDALEELASDSSPEAPISFEGGTIFVIEGLGEVSTEMLGACSLLVALLVACPVQVYTHGCQTGLGGTSGRRLSSTRSTWEP
jgi:hypothetical protein